jgi:hypothetical protein
MRIYLGCALYRVNRTDEASEQLEAVARELRTRPDSISLAQCLNAIASVHIAKPRGSLFGAVFDVAPVSLSAWSYQKLPLSAGLLRESYRYRRGA